jgi:CubicO group peptidase (beta-lactamase class C family)
MSKPADKLQATLEAQIGKGNIYNIVAAVQSHDRRVDFSGAAGVANPESGAAMTPDTPYFIASITKMYTAAVILRLHEQGRVDLEAPIPSYLPDEMVGGIHVYKGVDYSSQIKVYQLVNQSSGLADYEADKPPGGKSVLDELKAGGDRYIDTAEAVEITRRLSPHFPPGTPGKAYYSNTNYRLLGAIIEAVTGDMLAVNFQELLFTPLGLEHTYLFDWTAPRPESPPAAIYLKNRPANVPKYLASNIPDGALVSTAAESLRFLRAFFEGQLFSKALFERMMRWNTIFFPLRYGYGLMDFKLPRFFSLRPTPEFIGHSGSTGSFAFTCPAQSLYLAGTLNQIASPSKPFFLMTDLVRLAS